MLNGVESLRTNAMCADRLNSRHLRHGPQTRWNRGASLEAIEHLRKKIPSQIPCGYLNLLAATDGGEAALPVAPYNCCLDDATTVLTGGAKAWRQRWLEEGFFIIGGDGGGELLAFDLRTQGEPPIVAIDMVAGSESAMMVAPSVEAFVAMLGREEAA
ncbi:SMI1/KNR4 family protein [Roseateles sp. BYS87W]|uniref:SMI1/KNR4 family protein n=1 Tax=Pelomonas baiyunensis TaxID=3299026 RepID=A0ABW7GUB0_9BURK